ncbi:cytochrome C assembly family protein [Wohlfahrtiimonas chitiniclastica]|uniref:cytochrome C assembly family protein n=1 Tax=Wohlfahrtiimonas chitiniclastica TaxID=400946 RepID=UPI001FEE14DE|nr:cytochrome c biogenesis protein CcsA [Wohlfahrtiimonas chitiniclastica]
MNTLLFIVNIACYLIAILGMLCWVKGKLPKKSINVTLAFAWIGVISHAWMLSHALTIGSGAINIGAANAFSLTILAMLMIMLPNARKHPDLTIVAMVLAIISLVVSESYHSQLTLSGARPILSLHIILSIIAYAVLMVVGIQAAIIVLRHSYLKNPKGYFFSHLPPLMSMEKWLFQLMAIGAVLLSLSLLTALPFSDLWFDRQFIHRSILSIVSLVLFVTLLALHHFRGLRGKPAAKCALIAFIVLLVGVSGSRMVQELLLNRT